MVEIAGGELGTRPWGEVFAAFALDEGGCELAIDDGTYQYRVAFERNTVIAAASPLTADSALRVALTNGAITSAAVPTIMAVAPAGFTPRQYQNGLPGVSSCRSSPL